MSEEFKEYPDVNLNGLHTARAITNKWIGYVPLRNALGKKYRNLELDLVRFTIPQVSMGTTTISWKGISFKIPTHTINADDRTITFEYKVNENWYNYKSLYTWASAMGILNPVDGTAMQAVIDQENVAAALGVTTATTGVFDSLLDCRVWLLDNYKRRILDLVFHKCSIEHFSDLSLDFSQVTEVTHSFTMNYAYMTMEGFSGDDEEKE